VTSSHAGEAVFRARGVSKVYSKGDVEVFALRNVDLKLHRGEFVVISPSWVLGRPASSR
jgi:ABC-type nitrate/sulfonate/bicarbonate transport system ATPase subunit